jgi:hypothetical protein
VGEVADKDSAVADRLVRAAKQTLDLDIDYSSDGSVVLEAGLPIEAIRAAVHGPDSPPAAAQDGAMAALVIDARKLTVTPVVGISVTIGGERYRGPTIYALNAKSVAKDPRFKGKRTTVRATSYEAGALTLSGDESVVSEARGAGAAVVVLIKKMKP